MTTGRLIPGAILIILGALFLGANFGYLDWSFVASLWQLWPLILILVGVQLFFGQRQQWLAAVLMLIILAGGVALVLLGEERAPWFYGGSLTTATIDGPATAGVREAEARIDVGAARLDIGSRPGSVMATGTFETRGDPRVTHDVSGGTYTLEVQQENGVRIFPINVGGDRLILDLAEGVPWTIDMNTGAADANLDLTDLTLKELTVDAGASSLDLTVGSSVANGMARVVIKGGAGSYTLRLPQDLDITLTTDAGLSSTNVDNDFQKNGDVWRHTGTGGVLTVEVDAGVSSIKVELY